MVINHHFLKKKNSTTAIPNMLSGSDADKNINMSNRHINIFSFLQLLHARAKVESKLSKKSEFKVGIHHRSVLSHLFLWSQLMSVNCKGIVCLVK